MPEYLVPAVRAALATIADLAKAEPMRAFMRSAMPMLGVPVESLACWTSYW